MLLFVATSFVSRLLSLTRDYSELLVVFPANLQPFSGIILVA